MSRKQVYAKPKWANDQDKEYAQEWSENVTHGLFEKPTYVSKPVEEVAEETSQKQEQA